MPHSIPLITTLASAFGLALLLGFIADRIKLPVLVGYLLAGILLGPHTPGLVANSDIAKELAEIGVMLLMFGVGLHFSLNDLMAVRKIAIPGAILQMAVATLLGTWVATMWDWSLGGSLIFGLSLSVASTVVLLRALESHNLLDSISGRIAIGWLVVEDLAMVIVIVLLPPIASWLDGKLHGSVGGNLGEALGFTFIKVSAFLFIMMVVGRKIFPKILWHITQTGSRELFTLSVIATAITIAFIATKIFGVSFALGAFFAGMMMRESPLSHRAAEESLPLREAFAVLFFVSVGMLFNPMVIVDHFTQMLIVISIIMIGKTVAAIGLVLCFRYPLNSAFLVAASLAQIGEFSFILAALGVELGLLPAEGQSLILAGALISIALNPLLFKIMTLLHDWAITHLSFIKKLEYTADPLAALPMTTNRKQLSQQVVLIGYGIIGRKVEQALVEYKIPYVILDQNREAIEELRIKNTPAVFGDAADQEVFLQTHVARAKILIITISDTFNIPQIIDTARAVNSKIKILVKVQSEEDTELLKNKADKTFYSDNELANSMGNYVLTKYNKR